MSSTVSPSATMLWVKRGTKARRSPSRTAAPTMRAVSGENRPPPSTYPAPSAKATDRTGCSLVCRESESLQAPTWPRRSGGRLPLARAGGLLGFADPLRMAGGLGDQEADGNGADQSLARVVSNESPRAQIPPGDGRLRLAHQQVRLREAMGGLRLGVRARNTFHGLLLRLGRLRFHCSSVPGSDRTRESERVKGLAKGTRR